jgi:hypothetical protein
MFHFLPQSAILIQVGRKPSSCISGRPALGALLWARREIRGDVVVLKVRACGGIGRVRTSPTRSTIHTSTWHSTGDIQRRSARVAPIDGRSLGTRWVWRAGKRPLRADNERARVSIVRARVATASASSECSGGDLTSTSRIGGGDWHTT